MKGSSPKPLLILDMNKLLVFRAFDPELETSNPEAYAIRDRGHLMYQSRIWKRPELDSFLDFCFEHFTVAIWSSMKYHNLEATLKFVFSFTRRKKLRFVWCQNECTIVDPHPDPEEDKPLYKKPLKKVWAVFEEYNVSNTVIVDDSILKLEDNPLRCILCVSPWIPYAGDGMLDEAFAKGGTMRDQLMKKMQNKE